MSFWFRSRSWQMHWTRKQNGHRNDSSDSIYTVKLKLPPLHHPANEPRNQFFYFSRWRRTSSLSHIAWRENCSELSLFHLELTSIVNLHNSSDEESQFNKLLFADPSHGLTLSKIEIKFNTPFGYKILNFSIFSPLLRCMHVDIIWSLWISEQCGLVWESQDRIPTPRV